VLEELRHEFLVTRQRVRLLASRVEDERVRELATALAKAESYVPEEPGSEQALREFHSDYTEAVARIGELLRERY
jgi:hypothetical protein